MTGRMDHKLARHGDYLMAFRDTAGHATEPKIVVDNKDKATISPERRVALVTKIDKERYTKLPFEHTPPK